MEETPFDRTQRLVGLDGIERLRRASVSVFGVGGVGAYVAEALARAGVGRLVIIDGDRVAPSNLNRQLIALQSTLGRPKVEVAAQRFRDINPGILVEPHECFADAQNIGTLLESGTDYVVDAIDSVPNKVALLAQARRKGLPVVSCMGAAKRLDAESLAVHDIGKTQGCPLARVVRQRLKKQGITSGILCVHFTKPPLESPATSPPRQADQDNANGSISHVPGVVGLTAAGLMINAILGREPRLTP